VLDKVAARAKESAKGQAAYKAAHNSISFMRTRTGQRAERSLHLGTEPVALKPRTPRRVVAAAMP